MTQSDDQAFPVYRITESGLQQLMDALIGRGRKLLGPVWREGAVVTADVAQVDDLPRGVTDAQSAGGYTAERTEAPHLFAFNLGADSWKQFLFPSRSLLVEFGPDLIATSAPTPVETPLAFIGVRACDLAAMEVQAAVFAQGDDRYRRRLESTFIIGVHCQTAASTCFCPSMQTGPEFGPSAHLDLLITEIVAAQQHYFIAEPRSKEALQLFDEIDHEAAAAGEQENIAAQLQNTRSAIDKAMPPSARQVLAANPDAAHWEDVAARCLSCGNCTAVCPTCFCSDVVEQTAVDQSHTQRWQVWDSCFNASHSYTHSGTLRASTQARYRQWLTHKLSSWHAQFGRSGCVGCGRCITWCPVGIDLTEEVAALQDEADTHPGRQTRGVQ